MQESKPTRLEEQTSREVRERQEALAAVAAENLAHYENVVKPALFAQPKPPDPEPLSVAPLRAELRRVRDSIRSFGGRNFVLERKAIRLEEQIEEELEQVRVNRLAELEADRVAKAARVEQLPTTITRETLDHAMLVRRWSGAGPVLSVGEDSIRIVGSVCFVADRDARPEFWRAVDAKKRACAASLYLLPTSWERAFVTELRGDERRNWLALLAAAGLTGPHTFPDAPELESWISGVNCVASLCAWHDSADDPAHQRLLRARVEAIRFKDPSALSIKAAADFWSATRGAS